MGGVEGWSKPGVALPAQRAAETPPSELGRLLHPFRLRNMFLCCHTQLMPQRCVVQ
jgi:hypothetical protein